jgi:cell division septal protein FtsQ
MIGNRKRKRQNYLLEVKINRAGRLRRRLRLLAAVTLATVALCGSGYGMARLAKAASNRLVFENPRFAIREIVVETNGSLTPELATRFAGVRRGQNLLATDITQAARNLALIPLVRNVEVRRQMPDRLRIIIEERIPVARLRLPAEWAVDQEFYVDREAVVIKPLPLPDGTTHPPRITGRLPVLTGLTVSDLRVGRPVESESVQRAVELLQRLDESLAGALLEVERVDVSRPRELLLISDHNSVIRFDTEEFTPQLRRLAVILTWARQRQKIVQTVDLSVSRSVPVTFLN